MKRIVTITENQRSKNLDIRQQLIDNFFEFHLYENKDGSAYGTIVSKSGMLSMNDFTFNVKKIDNEIYSFEYNQLNKTLTDSELYEISLILLEIKLKKFEKVLYVCET